jgi:hypothetical protein
MSSLNMASSSPAGAPGRCHRSEVYFPSSDETFLKSEREEKAKKDEERLRRERVRKRDFQRGYRQRVKNALDPKTNEHEYVFCLYFLILFAFNFQ